MDKELERILLGVAETLHNHNNTFDSLTRIIEAQNAKILLLEKQIADIDRRLTPNVKSIR